MTRISAAITLVSFLLAGCPAAGPTAEINSQLATAWEKDGIVPSGRCFDRTFVRRIYLDLAGRVPTVEEMQTFLDDGRDEKREHLIDLLLKSEDHSQHFADLFDAILMGRTEEHQYDKRVKHGWRRYLEAVFRENRRWNEVAREILVARPNDKSRSGAVWFLYERNNEYQAIAEAVAPAFFGFRIECAQCHNHMSVDEIEQAHYWGLVAFFNRGKNLNTPNGPRIAESAIGGFSEFANLEGASTPNLLAFLKADNVEEPRPDKDERQAESDELYVSAKTDGDPRVPKFSRRQKFVTQVLDGHPMLARAMVNRIWAILMGRGIVHPHDEIDSMHPPSHPALLDWLVEDFAESGFDIRRLVRSIARSDAYQLRSRRPGEATPPQSFAWYLERPLTAEQLARSIQLVIRGSFRNDASVVKQLRQQILDVLPDEIEVPISEALFFSNHPVLDQFIRESTGDRQWITSLKEMEDSRLRAAVAIESVFHRSPEEDEIQAIQSYLEMRSDRLESALAQLGWSLITSAEFRFNH